MFHSKAIEALRLIFGKVCGDFQARLVEMDGEVEDVHLVVEYPAKVLVSTLVNSLKGVSEQAPASPAPGAWQAILEGRSLIAVLLCDGYDHLQRLPQFQ